MASTSTCVCRPPAGSETGADGTFVRLDASTRLTCVRRIGLATLVPPPAAEHDEGDEHRDHEQVAEPAGARRSTRSAAAFAGAGRRRRRPAGAARAAGAATGAATGAGAVASGLGSSSIDRSNQATQSEVVTSGFSSGSARLGDPVLHPRLRHVAVLG